MYGITFQLNPHRSLEERHLAANMLKEVGDIPCPLVVDSMDNNASYSYGAYPGKEYIQSMIFTPHVYDVMGVIVLTSCVCLSVSLSQPNGQTY